MRFFRKTARGGPAKSPDRRTRPFLEELESRVVPYSTTGNAWPSAQLITLSFMPDGTLVSQGTGGTQYSDLFAKMNAHTGWTTATWENAIISAAQSWAQYANINFSVVSDNGTAEGQGNYQQGDPGMGDIRFGEYSLGSGYLGLGNLPPPVNNYSAAGDIAFNDQQSYNIGSTYDLYTVAMHEVGHALGLGHSSTYSAVMYPSYHGTLKGLSADDISGIQAIYGARAADVYNQNGASNASFATAANLNPLLSSSTLTGQANNLDITSAGGSEYFALQAPSAGLLGNLVGGLLGGLLGVGTTTLTVNVQSAGLSLFRPQVTVYAADQCTVLGSATASGYNGGNLTVTLNGISPLQQMYIKVTGADTSAFSTGNYSLTFGFGSNTTLPSVPLPNTQLANGSVLSAGGGLAEQTRPTWGSATWTQSNGPERSDFYTINDMVPHPPGCGCGLCQQAVAQHQAGPQTVQLEMAPPAQDGPGLDSSDGLLAQRAQERVRQSLGSQDQGGTAALDAAFGAVREASHAHKGLDQLFTDPTWQNTAQGDGPLLL